MRAARSDFISFRINPDGKELRAQVAAFGFVEADVADIVGIGRAEVEVFVEETLRGVGVVSMIRADSWMA